ncbi:hypothetical protein [Ancylobacter sp.]|uniref:hypothetical protein n=1 Tax=Ancylobacter sp. TaxID=1872567 RepID=UPI003C7C26D3
MTAFRPLSTTFTAAALCLGSTVSSFGQGMTEAELKQTMATFINLKGYLCAEITQVTPLTLENTYEVECIEYRGGKKKVDYLFGIRAGGVVVEKR